MDERKLRDILPSEGIWTVDDFAKYLGVRSAVVQQTLSDMGVEVLLFGRLYRYRVFRLEDLKKHMARE
jgi:hypothetical protein